MAVAALLATAGATWAQTQCPGETAHTCTTCHDMPHQLVRSCAECHAKNPSLLLHPSGPGTPLADPAQACLACHMPGGFHPFPPVSSSVDLNLVCGQCHGGDAVGASTIGNIASGSPTLTVASATGFATGSGVTIAGAALVCGQARDLTTFVGATAGDAVTLVDTASRSVADAAVTVSQTKNGAPYFTLAQLTVYAASIHNDAPSAAFSYGYGHPDTLILNVDASTSLCSGSNASCDLYDWDWGDATAHGSGRTASHAYAAAGTYSVKLTVTQCGVQSGSVTVPVNLSAPDYPPVLSSTCAFNANTWTATVLDQSQDDHGVRQVALSWGDGSVISSQSIANPQPATPTNLVFDHTYLLPGTFTVSESVYDTASQRTTGTLGCSPAVAPSYFTVHGTVWQSNGTTPVGTALVQVKSGTRLLGQAYTASGGTYTIGLLKPGTYSVTVTKAGYSFPAPASFAVGPNATNDIVALTP